MADQARVVSFINMKGGVGKTTLAVAIAWELAKSHRVLLVDIDPQFNATQWLVDQQKYLQWLNDKNKRTILDVFAPDSGTIGVGGFARPNSARRTPAQLSNSVIEIKHGKTTLHLVPSTLELINLDSAPRGTENRLKTFLVEARNAFDYIIIDCPPTASLFSYSAYLASDAYLVPIKPDALSVIGLPLLERALEEYAQRSAHKISRLGLVMTLVRGTEAMNRTVAELRAEKGAEVFEQQLQQTTGIAEAVEEGLPLQIYEKTKHSLRDLLENLASEFTSRLDDL